MNVINPKHQHKPRENYYPQEPKTYLIPFYGKDTIQLCQLGSGL